MHQTKSPIPARSSKDHKERDTREFTAEEKCVQTLPENTGGSWKRPLVCGAAIVLIAFCLWTYGVVPFFTFLVDQWHYGDAHITRFDANIGRGNESFFAYSDNGSLVVVEVNKDHPEKSHIYTGITLNESKNSIVSLSVADALHNGKLDIIVSVGSVRYILFNKGDSLSWSS